MTRQMSAMRIHHLGVLSRGFNGLRLDTLPVPEPSQGEVQIRVSACGVCHTELDEIEGRSRPAHLPMTPGHQVIGTVVAEGQGCRLGLLGKTVGVAWIHSACGRCAYCRNELENLCPGFLASGRDRPGGYAEFMTAPENYVYEIPAMIPDYSAAPLLCAGAVGYRALRLARLKNGDRLGLTGFGASGHLVLKMAHHLFPTSPIHVFARSAEERQFAIELGACWVGDIEDQPPKPLDAVIDTTPAWLPLISALDALGSGGRLVVNALRKEVADHAVLGQLDYERHLWREKSIQTVANVTRADVLGLLQLAVEIPLLPEVTEYPLDHALEALLAIKAGHLRGALVLRVQQPGGST